MINSSAVELWDTLVGAFPGTRGTRVSGIGTLPLKPNKFYSCSLCISCKFNNRLIPKLGKINVKSQIKTISEYEKNDYDTQKLASIGQHICTYGLWICKRFQLVSETK